MSLSNFFTAVDMAFKKKDLNITFKKKMLHKRGKTIVFLMKNESRQLECCRVEPVTIGYVSGSSSDQILCRAMLPPRQVLIPIQLKMIAPR